MILGSVEGAWAVVIALLGVVVPCEADQCPWPRCVNVLVGAVDDRRVCKLLESQLLASLKDSTSVAEIGAMVT